eukprot:gene23371-9643_t
MDKIPLQNSTDSMASASPSDSHPDEVPSTEVQQCQHEEEDDEISEKWRGVKLVGFPCPPPGSPPDRIMVLECSGSLRPNILESYVSQIRFRHRHNGGISFRWTDPHVATGNKLVGDGDRPRESGQHVGR